MSEAELSRARDWLGDHFFDKEAPTFGAISSRKTRAVVIRQGIRGLVIDPYNEIEHTRPANMTNIPTLYDISGSANWANKAYNGILVQRDPVKDPTRTDLYIRKVRFKSVGKIGAVSLRWDRVTGRYSEIPVASK